MVFFPHAGGWSGSYRPLALAAPDDLECVLVELPGHGVRAAEQLLVDATLAARGAAAALAEAPDLPTVFFGHSLGALLAFEAQHALVEAGRRGCETLIVSACRSPVQVEARNRNSPARPTDSELIARLHELGGTPDAVFASADLLDFVLPPFRADTQMLASYRQRDRGRLSCRLVAFGGLADAAARRDHLLEWGVHADGPLQVCMYPGGHFYLFDRPDEIMRGLAEVSYATRRTPIEDLDHVQ